MSLRTLVIVALSIVVGVGCSDTASKNDDPNSSTNNGSSDNSSNNGSNNSANNVASNNGTYGGEVCPGFEAPPDGIDVCRSDMDCDGGGYCAPTANTSCGVPCDAVELCQTDEDCADNLVCQRYDASERACCGPGDSGSECKEACTDESCPEGESCEDDGHCRPTSCEDGYDCGGLVCAPDRDGANSHGCVTPDCTIDDDFTCPEGTECDAGSTAPNKCAPIHCDDGYECPENSRCDSSEEGHGCVLLSCTEDTDCDCGSCVNELCRPHFWRCAYAAP